MNTATSLSLGGLALSLVIAYANLWPWWKSGHDPKKLIPFGEGLALGSVSTICAGGLLGVLAGCSAGAGNTVGDKTLSGVTGVQGGAAFGRGDLGHLTPEGAVVVLLMTVGVVLAWRAAGKNDKKKIAGGVFVGTTLSLTAGVAGLLGFLPDAINMIGQQGRATLEGAGIL
ncbi:hypothetical protein [Streptomyces paromomycinus]|uniref:Uncharacterized protein n=1 Tax=Streptomyces paromomycinus TaxID=92743 RepID=A0A401WA12_STREY|nr:hypothetical protein [Streptomyces paromomycinus]GCD46131.1 hypothetical protein GKJPGBOP_05878 [Streptomyces paromomycinus]